MTAYKERKVMLPTSSLVKARRGCQVYECIRISHLCIEHTWGKPVCSDSDGCEQLRIWRFGTDTERVASTLDGQSFWPMIPDIAENFLGPNFFWRQRTSSNFFHPFHFYSMSPKKLIENRWTTKYRI